MCVLLFFVGFVRGSPLDCLSQIAVLCCSGTNLFFSGEISDCLCFKSQHYVVAIQGSREDPWQLCGCSVNRCGTHGVHRAHCFLADPGDQWHVFLLDLSFCSLCIWSSLGSTQDLIWGFVFFWLRTCFVWGSSGGTYTWLFWNQDVPLKQYCSVFGPNVFGTRLILLEFFCLAFGLAFWNRAAPSRTMLLCGLQAV